MAHVTPTVMPANADIHGLLGTMVRRQKSRMLATGQA
jgi:hypothetical protein